MLLSWAIDTLTNFTLIYHALTWPVPSFESFTPAVYPTPTLIPNPICELIGPTQPLPQLTPTSKPQPPPATNLNDVVNQYRSSIGLPKLSTRADLCNLSKDRLNEVIVDFNHDGFRRRIDAGVFSALGFTAFAENIWQGNGYPKSALESWVNSPGHKANLEGDYQYGCGVVANDRAVFLFAR